MSDENNKDGAPALPSEQKPNENPSKETQQDTDFEKELENLEKNKKPQSKRTELEKATFTAASAIKRIKELGGDPKAILPEDKEEEQPQPDASQFVTKTDLARQEAAKLAKSGAELNLIMWYVENKGMSVEDAHFMANKNRIQKSMSEINRSQGAIPASSNGGPGQIPQSDTTGTPPPLSALDQQAMNAAGMVFDASKKAYVGQKFQVRWTGKEWVQERIAPKAR